MGTPKARGSFLQWFKRELTPGDLVTAVSVIIAGLGVLFAFLQFRDALSQEAHASQQAARQNQEIARQDEDNAPFLIPATPPAERGFVKTADLNFGHVTKRADRLYVAPPNPHAGVFKARMVIPLQNGGTGIALIYGRPAFVSGCDVARELAPRLAIPAGTYVVRSGEADQFGFFQPSIRGGRLPDGGWYSFDYNRWGESRAARPRGRGPAYTPFGYERNINVIVWYSDGARSKLRWSCAEYIYAGVGRGGLEYAVTGQTFGDEGRPPV